MQLMMHITFVFLIFKPVIGQVKKQLYLVQIYQALIADPIEGFQSSPFSLWILRILIRITILRFPILVSDMQILSFVSSMRNQSQFVSNSAVVLRLFRMNLFLNLYKFELHVYRLGISFRKTYFFFLSHFSSKMQFSIDKRSCILRKKVMCSEKSFVIWTELLNFSTAWVFLN